MNTRLTLIVVLAVLGVVVNVSVTDAQINPFGDYWANVARAAQSNDAARVRSLLASDGNPNQADGDSRTALHYAAMNGNLTIIAILIKASAKLDVKDKLGNTPLHLAAERNEPDAAQLLLDVGASVDAENKNGMTPLMMAASHGNIAVVQALLAKGASVTKTDFTGRDAARWAAALRLGRSREWSDGTALAQAHHFQSWRERRRRGARSAADRRARAGDGIRGDVTPRHHRAQ